MDYFSNSYDICVAYITCNYEICVGTHKSCRNVFIQFLYMDNSKLSDSDMYYLEVLRIRIQTIWHSNRHDTGLGEVKQLHVLSCSIWESMASLYNRCYPVVYGTHSDWLVLVNQSQDGPHGDWCDVISLVTVCDQQLGEDFDCPTCRKA